MSNATQNAPAAPAVVVAFTDDDSVKLAKGVGHAFKLNRDAKERAERDLLRNIRKGSTALAGIAITEDTWAKLLAAKVTKEVTKYLAASSVPGAVSRAKTIVVAQSTRPLDWEGDKAVPKVPHWSDPLAGESAGTYCERVRPLLRDAKFPDGTWVMAHEPDGTLSPRSGAKPLTDAEKAAKAAADKAAKIAATAAAADAKAATLNAKPEGDADSAGDAAKTEGGNNASRPALVAAEAMFPSDAATALRLAIAIERFPDRLAVWLIDLASAESLEPGLDVTKARQEAKRLHTIKKAA
jgi:hypothetical protein